MNIKPSIILLSAFALAACGAIGGTTAAPLPTVVLNPGAATQPASSSAPAFGGSVSASGHVAPAQQAQLAFAAPGQVLTLTVAAGDTVQAGQVLATLAGGDRL